MITILDENPCAAFMVKSPFKFDGVEIGDEILFGNRKVKEGDIVIGETPDGEKTFLRASGVPFGSEGELVFISLGSPKVYDENEVEVLSTFSGFIRKQNTDEVQS